MNVLWGAILEKNLSIGKWSGMYTHMWEDGGILTSFNSVSVFQQILQ